MIHPVRKYNELGDKVSEWGVRSRRNAAAVWAGMILYAAASSLGMAWLIASTPDKPFGHISVLHVAAVIFGGIMLYIVLYFVGCVIRALRNPHKD